jgi:hypothetical protein
LIWNRLKYVKNPNTGKRQSRLNPTDAWIIKEVPELCIVPPELWDAVKARQMQMARITRPDALEIDCDLTVKWRDPHLLDQAADDIKGLATVFRVTEHRLQRLDASAVDCRKVGVQERLLLWGLEQLSAWPQ